MKIYEEKIYFNCYQCSKKEEKNEGMEYADSWYCDERCLFKYLKENEAELADILNESDLTILQDEEKSVDNDEDGENGEGDSDPNYDPMDDF